MGHEAGLRVWPRVGWLPCRGAGINKSGSTAPQAQGGRGQRPAAHTRVRRWPAATSLGKLQHTGKAARKAQPGLGTGGVEGPWAAGVLVQQSWAGHRPLLLRIQELLLGGRVTSSRVVGGRVVQPAAALLLLPCWARAAGLPPRVAWGRPGWLAGSFSMFRRAALCRYPAVPPAPRPSLQAGQAGGR